MITFAQYLAESQWKFGSGNIPKTYMEHSPFPKFPALSKLRKTKYMWEDKVRDVSLVPVKELFSWQEGVDSDKISTLEDPNYPPIKVNQIAGKLVIMNGNHRASAAFVQGLKYVKAHVANFDDEKAQRFWQNKSEFQAMPLHNGVIPFAASKVFSK